jgi:hypothetical protein
VGRMIAEQFAGADSKKKEMGSSLLLTLNGVKSTVDPYSKLIRVKSRLDPSDFFPDPSDFFPIQGWC